MRDTKAHEPYFTIDSSLEDRFVLADLRKEIEKRRTFAIISHPDAGKTTLTEKFLLYGGAIKKKTVSNVKQIIS